MAGRLPDELPFPGTDESGARTEEQVEKIRSALTYRCSDQEVDDGVCGNCGRTFVFQQDGRDHMCPKPNPKTVALRVNRDDLDRRWVCVVVRSGYHNGAHCSPRDPHSAEAWGCGYRTECRISLTDEQMEDWA